MTATLSKQDRLNTILSDLRGAMPELRGVLVATVDGLPIAQSMGDGADANRVAAMAATAAARLRACAATSTAGSRKNGIDDSARNLMPSIMAMPMAPLRRPAKTRPRMRMAHPQRPPDLPASPCLPKSNLPRLISNSRAISQRTCAARNVLFR